MLGYLLDGCFRLQYAVVSRLDDCANCRVGLSCIQRSQSQEQRMSCCHKIENVDGVRPGGHSKDQHVRMRSVRKPPQKSIIEAEF